MGMDAPKVTRLLGVVVTLFLLLLSGLAALATPVMTLPSSVTIPEDDATNLVFSVSDLSITHKCELRMKIVCE